MLVISYALVQAVCCVRASKILHGKMLINVLRGPMWFFDTTPVGRIVNRFSQDIEAIDSTLPHMFGEVLYSFYLVFSILIIISYSTPIFLSVIVPVGVVYIMLQVRFYFFLAYWSGFSAFSPVLEYKNLSLEAGADVIFRL